MKIVYVSNSIVPSRTANSIHVMKMCQSLAMIGHEVNLIAYCRNNLIDDIYDYYGVSSSFIITLIRAMNMRGATAFSLPRLYCELRKYKSSNTLVYARSIYGASIATSLGYRVVYETHWPPPNALIRCLEKSLFARKGFQKLVVISESLKRIYLSIFGKIRIVEVCHDAASIPSVNTNVDYTWPCKRDRLQIGYTGHLYRGRGIGLILQCACRLPQYDFHIVGGMEKDIEYWRQNRGANVYFHGFVKPSLIPIVLNKCDVLLMPYQNGLSVAGKKIDTSKWMSPMKLFEYMASRRVIVASNLSVLKEVLNKNNSILVDPESVNDWVSAIRTCENFGYRHRLAKSAYEELLSNYTWDKRAIKALEDVKL